MLSIYRKQNRNLLGMMQKEHTSPHCDILCTVWSSSDRFSCNNLPESTPDTNWWYVVSLGHSVPSDTSWYHPALHNSLWLTELLTSQASIAVLDPICGTIIEFFVDYFSTPDLLQEENIKCILSFWWYWDKWTFLAGLLDSSILEMKRRYTIWSPPYFASEQRHCSKACSWSM